VSDRRSFAVFSHSLHDPRPRGVQRVARAITEELLRQLPPDVKCYCLLQKISQQTELTYMACDLRSWLATHPLVIDEPRRGKFMRRVRRLGELLTPPIFGRLRDRLWPLAQRYLDELRIVSRLRSIKARFQSDHVRNSQHPPAHALPAEWITLDEIDTLVSFEAFDEIWSEPTHRVDTQLVCYIHDAIPKRIDEGHYWNPDHFDRAVSNACYRADQLICVSRSTQTDLLRFFPPAEGKSQVVGLGHDAKRFAEGATSDPRAVDAVLKRHGISPNMPYLFFLGALEARKNIVHILKACETLRRQKPRLEFQLVLAGDASGLAAAGGLIERTRRHLPVHVLPYTTDQDAAILTANARAFVFTALWEGFGIPLLEAMTAGTLVVTSDLSSMPEVGGEHALYADPYDPQDMAERFLECLTMDERQRRRRIAAAREYSAQFTWRKAAERLLSVMNAETPEVPAEAPLENVTQTTKPRVCA
jgi:glycosyltransferase involved in cell wall biosynthesis